MHPNQSIGRKRVEASFIFCGHTKYIDRPESPPMGKKCKQVCLTVTLELDVYGITIGPETNGPICRERDISLRLVLGRLENSTGVGF